MKRLFHLLLLLAFPAALPAAEVQKMFAARIEIPERGAVPGYLCVLGTNKFSFIAPTGWKPEAKLDRHEVIFISPELDASLTFKIREGAQPPSGANAEEQLLQRFPNAAMVDTFNCYAANQVGDGYILEQQTATNGKLKVRYGAVSIPGGTAEFILRAPAVRMPDLRLTYGRFLASFRVSSRRAQP